jgi:hypothetical protein
MRKPIIILLAFLLGSCQVVTIELPSSFVEKYIDIEDKFPTKDFDKIATFIYENGELDHVNQLFFKYNGSHQAYLMSKPGVPTPINNPAATDFNRLSLSGRILNNDSTTTWYNYNLLIVREGDLSDSTLFYTVPEGMRENKVYIVNYYHEDIDTIRANTLECIDRLKVAMKNKK